METNIMDMVEYPKSGILSKTILKGKSANISFFCMAKGSEIEDHTSTKEGTVYVVEGDGEFVLEGKKIAMKKGVLIHMEKNAVHSLSAKENTSFILTLWS